MLYAPRKLRGLSIINCEWEAYLQHFSIAKKLLNVNDGLLHCSFDSQTEINLCIEKMNVTGDDVKDLRYQLRFKSFQSWCAASYQGIGVQYYADYTPSNNFITNKNSLSSSEWTAAIKLNSNYASLAGVPGVQNTSNPSYLCRRCQREKETIPHVLGSCSYNERLITMRHHKIKKMIIDILKERDMDCFEEVSCVDIDGSRRYCDIVAFPKKNKEKAYILDPTIRYESNDPQQAEKIDLEKRKIYEPCIDYLKKRNMTKNIRAVVTK
ncbi:hypothetical protein WDU94_006625 [Cyamophila willieti]